MAVQVQVLDEKGLPVHCTVAAVRTSDQTILNLYTADVTGVVTINEAGVWYPRPMVDPNYKARIRMVILNASGNMNSDYVVDGSGGGTHTALFGANGALQAALATGVSKSIWVCSTHTETPAAQEVVGALAANQVITISSLGPSGATISWNSLAGAAAIKFNATSPSTASLNLDRINLAKNANSDPLFEAASGFTLPNISLVRVGFVGGVKWSFVVDLANSNTAVPQQLTLDGCWGTQLASVVRTTFNTPSATAAFIMKNCDLPGLATISQRDTEAAVEWGGSNAGDGGVLIRGNKLGISNYAWHKTYIAPFNFTGNLILHSGAVPLLALGSASATPASKNATVTGNAYYGSQVGCSFALLQNTTGPCDDICIVGNELNGPGSGTAITTIASANCAFEPNGFTGWTTNVAGAGVTKFSGGVSIAGSFAATIAHGGLTGLVAPADDHTQYAKLSGRGSPIGNIFSGYASWGTGAANYSGTVLGLPGLKAYWRCGEVSGNLTDSSANANTMVAHGAATYGVAGAIAGDSNTAISLNQNAANYFEAPNSASLNVADVFSVVAWIKITTIGADQRIITQATNGYDLEVSPTGALRLAKDGVAIIVTSTTNMVAGQYYMVAATKNGATVHLYINGTDVTGVVSNQTCTGPGGVTRIGQNVADGLSPFGGSIDEVALWNVALTTANITSLYNAGTGGAPAPTNNNDGDVTASRVNIGNVAFTGGARFNLNVPSFVPAALHTSSLITTVYAPSGLGSTAAALEIDAHVQNTALDAGEYWGAVFTVYHDGGSTFALTGTPGLVGLEGTIVTVAGATGAISEADGVRASIRPVAASTITWASAFRAIPAGSGADAGGPLTNAAGLYIQGRAAGVSVGTLHGLYIEVLSGGSVDNIAIRTLGGTHRLVGAVNFGTDVAPDAAHLLDIHGSTVIDNQKTLDWRDSGGIPRAVFYLGSDNETNLSVAGGAGKHFRVLNQAQSAMLWEVDNVGVVTWGGPTVLTPSASQTLVAATAILANATSVQITAAGAITLTANPMIAAGTDGQVLTIVNVGANAITLNTNGVKYGNAGAAPVLKQDSTIVLQYNAGRAVWEQTGGVL